MAVSKVIKPNAVTTLAPSIVTTSSNYAFTAVQGSYHFYVTRCGQIVTVCGIISVKAGGTPSESYPGEMIASGLPRVVQNVFTNFARGYVNTASNDNMLAINMVTGGNNGKLFCRYGTAGRQYPIYFSYITDEQ